jgi:arylsulfate sulfotransferase
MNRSSLLVAATLMTTTAALSASCAAGSDTKASVSAEPVESNVLAAELVIDADEAVRVEVTARSGEHVVEVPVTAEAADSHEIPVVGMRAESEYTIEARLLDDSGDQVGSEEVDFTTGSLPEFIPEMEVTVDADGRAEGLTLVELNPREREDMEEDPLSVQQVVALDPEGEVVRYAGSEEAMGDVRLTEEGLVQSINFPGGLRRTDMLGNMEAYWQVRPEIMPWADPDELEEFTSDTEASEADANDATVISADWVDLRSIHHEVFPMPDGNLLVLSNTLHELTPDQRSVLCPGDPEEFWAISDVVAEVTPDGEVVRTWDMWDVLDVMEVPGGEMCSTEGQIADEIERDWTHGNAVIYDPERDAVIVSNRHTSNIVALDHGDAEGPQSGLRWVVGEGGTIPLEGDVPRYQHAPELQEDGSILFYDNGNNRAGTGEGGVPPWSRATVYEVDDTSGDPAEWSATQRWEHLTEEDPGEVLFAGFLGDADRLANGNVLITHGGIPRPNPEDDHNRCVVIEVVPSDSTEADEDGNVGGEVVWRLETGTAERPVTCYRAAHLESLYAGDSWLGRS